jgi:hypothetical protein
LISLADVVVADDEEEDEDEDKDEVEDEEAGDEEITILGPMCADVDEDDDEDKEEDEDDGCITSSNCMYGSDISFDSFFDDDEDDDDEEEDEDADEDEEDEEVGEIATPRLSTCRYVKRSGSHR